MVNQMDKVSRKTVTEVVVGLGNRLRASALLSVVPGLCRIVYSGKRSR